MTKKPYSLIFEVHIMAQNRESAFEESTLVVEELVKQRGIRFPVLIYSINELIGTYDGSGELELIEKAAKSQCQL